MLLGNSFTSPVSGLVLNWMSNAPSGRRQATPTRAEDHLGPPAGEVQGWWTRKSGGWIVDSVLFRIEKSLRISVKQGKLRGLVAVACITGPGFVFFWFPQNEAGPRYQN